jgi:hypothetical protein
MKTLTPFIIGLTVLTGCQSNLKSNSELKASSPATFELNQLIETLAKKNCSANGKKSTSMRVWQIKQAQDDPFVISAAIDDPIQRLKGKFFYNINTKAWQCGPSSAKAKGLEYTNWISISEAEARKLIPNAPLPTVTTQNQQRKDPVTSDHNNSISGSWRVVENCKLPNGEVRSFRGIATLTTPYQIGKSTIYQIKYVADYGDIWTGTVNDKNSELIIELDPDASNREKTVLLYDAVLSAGRNNITAMRGTNCEMTAVMK